MITRRAFVGGAALTFAAPGLLRAQAPRTLKISHQFPGGSIEQGDFRDRLCRRFADNVENRTGGALKLEVYPASSLMKTDAQFAALRAGTLDFSLYPLPYAGNEVQAMNLGQMPCLVTSYDQAAKWKDASIGKSLSQIAEAKGVKFISWVWQAGGMASASTPVTNPDSAKGLKISGGSREMNLMLAAAGAKVPAPSQDEIYAAMQSGRLDAAFEPSTTLISMNLQDVAKSLTTAGGGSIGFLCVPLLMSKAVFESLSPDHQKVIVEAGQEIEWFATIEAKKDDQAAAKAYAAKGAAVADMTADDIAKWREVAEQSVWRDFASKSGEAADLLASAKSVA